MDVLFAALVAALMAFLIGSFVRAHEVAPTSPTTDVAPSSHQDGLPTNCNDPSDEVFAGFRGHLPLC